MTTTNHRPTAPSSIEPNTTDDHRYDAIAVQIKIASAITIGFGALISFGSHTLTDGPLRFLADLFFWPLDDNGPVTDEAQLLAAILGGVMIGWGALYWMLTDALLPSHPKLLRRLILTTMALWFVIDSAGSLAAGSWLNVVSNVAFLAAFVLPARRL